MKDLSIAIIGHVGDHVRLDWYQGWEVIWQ